MLLGRPDRFKIDLSHPLARGLTVAWLPTKQCSRRIQVESPPGVPRTHIINNSVQGVPQGNGYDPIIGRGAVRGVGGTAFFSTPHKMTSNICSVFHLMRCNQTDASRKYSLGTKSSYDSNGFFFETCNTGTNAYLRFGATSLGFGFRDVRTWYVFGFTYDGTTLRMYKNGAEVASTTTADPKLIGSNELTFLRLAYDASTIYGDVSDTFVYDRPLNDAEIWTISDLLDPMYSGLLYDDMPILYINTVSDLVANEVEAAPVVDDAPALGIVHVLNANAVSVAVIVLAAPLLGQVHAVLTDDVVVSSALGTPNLSINAGPVALAAHGITSSVSFNNPGLTQVHGLTTSTISSSVTAEHPGIGQTHVLLTQGMVVQPSVAHPILRTIQDLSAVGLSSTATVGQPAITVVSNIAKPDGIVSAALVTHSAISQIHNLTPLNIVVPPVNECPVLLQEHSLTALGIVSTVFLASPKVLAWVFLPKHYVELPSQGLTQLELATIGRFDVERNSNGIMQVVVAADGTVAFEETTFGVLNKQKTSLGVLQLRLISTGRFSLTDIGG